MAHDHVCANELVIQKVSETTTLYFKVRLYGPSPSLTMTQTKAGGPWGRPRLMTNPVYLGGVCHKPDGHNMENIVPYV